MHVLEDGPRDAQRILILAHGAGGPMDAPFMNRVARGIAAHEIRVARFEFPYMQKRRESGRRGGAPDRPPVLMETWREVIDRFRADAQLFIGGKSLGGRIATMVADASAVAGVICFGYPFHPPSDPAKLRTGHLETLQTPALIIQGERDPFGSRAEVESYQLPPTIRFEWLPDGDHSFKPRSGSGVTEKQNVERAIASASAFICDEH